MDEFIISKNDDLNGGTQKVYRFPNNYGASLIEGGSFAYGGRELAVLWFYGPGDRDAKLVYDTPITDDVIGYLSESDVEPLLARIQNLPTKEAS